MSPRYRSIAGTTTMVALLLALLAGCVPGTGGGNERRSAETSPSPSSAGGGDVATIYLAGGCFWGVEKYMAGVRGVINAESGYANGHTDSPTYGDVSSGRSGYTETVKVDYDPDVAPLEFLLDLYYKAVDPTSVNRQGNDIGTQYRTGIYYADEADRPIIERSLAKLQERYERPIAIEAQPLTSYTPAEEYHQDYLDKNPNGYCHIGKQLFEDAAKAVPGTGTE